MTTLVSLLIVVFLTCRVAVCSDDYTDSHYGGDDNHRIGDGYGHNNQHGYKDSVDCGPLPDIKNGKVEIVPDTKKASIATYICDEGFLLYGKEIRICAHYGKWTGRAPKCIPVDCKGLPGIANGRLILSGTGYRDTATYLCKAGFDLVGNRQRKCKEDGEWSGEAPVCESESIKGLTMMVFEGFFPILEITCPKLSKPENGNIFVSGNEPSDFAIYSCKYGFYRDGQRRRECQRTGEWSGMEPTCKKLEPVVNEKSSSYIPPYEEEEIPEHPHPADPTHKVDDDYYGDAPYNDHYYYHDDHY